MDSSCNVRESWEVSSAYYRRTTSGQLRDVVEQLITIREKYPFIPTQVSGACTYYICIICLYCVYMCRRQIQKVDLGEWNRLPLFTSYCFCVFVPLVS